MKLQKLIEQEKKLFLKTEVGKPLLLLVTGLTLLYFFVIAFMFPAGNKTLFYILIAGEVFHLWQVLTYVYTVWQTEHSAKKDESYMPNVDIFITVVGEPQDIIEETVRAAKAIEYEHKNIYILNDGYVAKKDTWKDTEELAKRLGVGCITRKIPGGAKAGNVNNALRETGAMLHLPADNQDGTKHTKKGGELVVVFDADHVPHPDFLKKTVPYFVDPKVAFVQSPQFYKNFRTNYITQSSWEQQQLFFGPICKGKNRLNSATMCGTNMVIRRDMLNSVGGMSEISIAEDFLTGMMLHQKGWKSIYVPEVLAEGLAPEDFLSYYKQQFRWARGALDVFGHGMFLRSGLTIAQKIQYLASVSFYFSGLVVLMNAGIPLIYFFAGQVPLVVSTMLLATIFLPYIFLTLFMIQRSSNYTFTFRALTFSMGGFSIHIKAIWAALTRQKTAFHVTPKRQQEGNFVHLVVPHIVYIVVLVIGMAFAFIREGASASFIANSAWGLLNVGVFIPFIYAALPQSVKAKKRSAAIVSRGNKSKELIKAA